MPKQSSSLSPLQTGHYHKLAAIDMGSNSFHMVIARLEEGELRPIERIGEKVQLARGLVKGKLTEEAMQRGLACLERFAQRLRLTEMPEDGLRVVGTNTLRAARNANKFIARAEKILGYPVNVIPGVEEARLVYLGVSHSLADDKGDRLVIDIGGGSTELILGKRFESHAMESLHMGCVAFLRFFPNGEISQQHYLDAYRAAYVEILNIIEEYDGQWTHCIGSSGTLRAIEKLSVALGLSQSGINAEGLQAMRQKLLAYSHIDEVDFECLKADRNRLLAPGLAIVSALFDALHIKQMETSDGALREGVLYDLLGRLSHEDVRERTVSALEKRYSQDLQEAAKVEAMAMALLDQVKGWPIKRKRDRRLLSWAARLHSIGLVVSHSGFHKHGEYLITNSDLAGFSRQEQRDLAILVRLHRRKISSDTFEGLTEHQRGKLLRLAVLLRIAIIIRNAKRQDGEVPFSLEIEDETRLSLHFGEAWLSNHPLAATEFQREQRYLQAAGMTLQVS